MVCNRAFNAPQVRGLMNLREDSSRKYYLSLSVLLVLAASLTLASLARQTSAATVSAGVVIPLYNYPDSTWTTIAQTAKANPSVPMIAIINPDSGPGSSEDPNYLAGVQNLQSSGVKVLGYVATGYATSSYSSISSVESLANQYESWYKVNGIFFDEMSNVAAAEPYYSTLNAYVKSDGMTYTMGNPGTSVPTGYIGILDNLVIDENSGYPSLSSITYAGYPASDFSFIAYGVSYDGAFVTSAASLVGYMYIDDLGGGNPYWTLSSLFTETVATLAALDGAPASSSSSSSSSSTSSSSSSTSSTSTNSTTTTTTSTTSVALPPPPPPPGPSPSPSPSPALGLISLRASGGSSYGCAMFASNFPYAKGVSCAPSRGLYTEGSPITLSGSTLLRANGSAAPSQTIYVWINGVIQGPVTSGSNGDWSLSFTPATSGTFLVSVSQMANGGGVASPQLKLTVLPAPASSARIATYPPLPT